MSACAKRKAYELLNIPAGSDAKTIRSAWRALVRTYHPDQAKADPKAANARLAEINAAFDVLMLDPNGFKPHPSAKPEPHAQPRRKPAPRKPKPQAPRPKTAVTAETAKPGGTAIGRFERSPGRQPVLFTPHQKSALRAARTGFEGSRRVFSETWPHTAQKRFA